MGLNGRVVKLESRLAAPEDDADVQLWAQLFASARRWPEDRETTENQVLEADRRLAREFFAYCQCAGDEPTFAALNKWAHCGSEG